MKNDDRPPPLSYERQAEELPPQRGWYWRPLLKVGVTLGVMCAAVWVFWMIVSLSYWMIYGTWPSRNWLGH